MPVLDVKKLPPTELKAAKAALQSKASEVLANHNASTNNPPLNLMHDELLPVIRHYMVWGLAKAVREISLIVNFDVTPSNLSRFAISCGIPSPGNRKGKVGNKSPHWGAKGI